MDTRKHIPGREFPVTRWSLIGRAGASSSATSIKALDELLRRYAPAMVAHLVYMKRLPPDLAEDYAQSFIAEKVLQDDLLKKAEPGRGKFRTFLLTSLDRFVISQIRKEQAAKRSPGEGGHVNIDDVAEIVEAPSDGSDAFDVAWARSIVHEALKRVQAECDKKKISNNWRLFEARVVKPLLEGAEVPPYEVLSKELNFASPMQASNALITAKRIFARKLNEVILEYVDDDEDVEKEIGELRAVLAGISA